MVDEWSGTLTLTEESTKELLRVLKEKDEQFINDVLDGKCGFTLKGTDGREVELVPKADRKTKPQNADNLIKQADEMIAFDKEMLKDEPQTETGTDCSWK